MVRRGPAVLRRTSGGSSGSQGRITRISLLHKVYVSLSFSLSLFVSIPLCQLLPRFLSPSLDHVTSFFTSITYCSLCVNVCKQISDVILTRRTFCENNEFAQYQCNIPWSLLFLPLKNLVMDKLISLFEMSSS